MMLWVLLVSFLSVTNHQASAFLLVGISPSKLATKVLALHQHRCKSSQANKLCTTPENDAVYTELHNEIRSIARELWEGREMPCLSSTASPTHETTTLEGKQVTIVFEGEAGLPEDVPVSERGDYFRKEALRGCPSAQHSYGLLLWSGYAGTERNPGESAKFHAAAACQHHLDGMAVFGGCLRTGKGIPKKTKNKKTTNPNRNTNNTVTLGLKLIDFCASEAVGNPAGVTKQAALFESNGDDFRAVELCEACLGSGRANAHLFFTLGWFLVNGRGVDRKDRDRGIALWKEATELAPDQGSEEAAWNLYQEYVREDPKEAQRWLDLAEDLGYWE